MADVTIFVLICTNKFITVKIDFWLFTVSTWLQDFTFFGDPDSRHFLDRFFNLAIDVANITIFVLVGTNEFITVKIDFWLLTVCTRFQNFTFFSNPNRRHFLDWFFNLTVDMSGITVFVLIGTNEFITVKVFLRMFTIGARFKNLAFFSHPDSSHFLDWFFDRAIDVCCITIFVLIRTNEFITVKVFLRLFTVSARLQDFTFLRHPDSSHFLDWFLNLTVDMSDISVFVLICTNEFITVKVFLRMFTVSTRFQNLAFFSNPNSSYFLDRFFDRAIDMCGITILVLIRANKYITVKVFLWMFTVSTRFQNLTFFGDPNSGHFLDWFFNWTIDMSSVTIFVFIRTNEFIAIEVFFWLFTVSTRFQNLTVFGDPNSGHFLDWFFNRTVNVSGDGTIHFCFHKLITWECVLRFEIWCHNRSLQCCPCYGNPSCGFQFCHRTFLNRERRNLCRCYLWCLWFDRRSCCRIRWVLRLWTIWSLWFFWFFTSFWSWFFWFFTSFWSRRCRRGCWWRIW